MTSKTSVRTEKYVNYFTYNYPEPAPGEKVSLNTEIIICPWNGDHHIMRLELKGKAIPFSELPNSNYVFLINVPGSVNSRLTLPLHLMGQTF